MTTYKFRAECYDDVEQFEELADNLISHVIVTVAYPEIFGHPDVIVTFDSEQSIESLIALMQYVDDSHVMHQTLKPINEYTGERDYSL